MSRENPVKPTSQDFNNGVDYRTARTLFSDAEAEAMAEGVLYAVQKVDAQNEVIANVEKPITVVEDTTDPAPSVELTDDGFVFKNIRGEKGKDGKDGSDGDMHWIKWSDYTSVDEINDQITSIYTQKVDPSVRTNIAFYGTVPNSIADNFSNIQFRPNMNYINYSSSNYFSSSVSNFYSLSMSNASFTNFIFYNSISEAPTAVINGGHDLDFISCKFVNAKGYSVDIYNGYNVYFENCEFKGNSWEIENKLGTVHIYGTQNGWIMFESCTFNKYATYRPYAITSATTTQDCPVFVTGCLTANDGEIPKSSFAYEDINNTGNGKFFVTLTEAGNGSGDRYYIKWSDFSTVDEINEEIQKAVALKRTTLDRITVVFYGTMPTDIASNLVNLQFASNMNYENQEMPNYSYSSNAVFLFNHLSNITVKNFVFQTGSSSSPCVSVQSCNNIEFIDCTFKANIVWALGIEASYHLYFENCTFNANSMPVTGHTACVEITAEQKGWIMFQSCRFNKVRGKVLYCNTYNNVTAGTTFLTGCLAAPSGEDGGSPVATTDVEKSSGNQSSVFITSTEGNVNAQSVDYLTTAPTSENTNGLKFVVLSSEPTTKYNGYIYLIEES